MACPRSVPRLLFVLLAAGTGSAWPSDRADLATCEAQLAKEPRGEAPATCLYDLARGTGPSRTAAALRLQELRETDPENPWILLRLASLKWSTGAPGAAEAQEMYRQTAELAARRGMARAEILARTGLIRTLRDAGRLQEAEREVEHAIRVADRSGDPALQAKARIVQATHLSAMGYLEKAYVALRRINEAVARDGSYALTKDYLFALINAAQQTGRLSEARRECRRLADLAAAAGDSPSEAMALFGLAKTLLEELGEMPTASGRAELLGLTRRALNTSRKAGRPDVEAYSLWLLGSFGGDAEAKVYLDQCSTAASTPRMRSHCRGALARRLAASAPAEAQEAIHEALALAHESGDAVARTSAWHERMRVSWALEPPEMALKSSQAALDAIEALRDQQGASAGQPGLFSTWAEDYYWLSGQLLQAGKLEPAFKTLERMRSRTLIDALGLSPDPQAAPALYARRAEIFLDIARLQRRLLDAPPGSAELAREKAELVRVESEESALRAEIARADPSYAAFRPDFASLEEIRESLSPDEALLSFQIAPRKDLAGDFGGGSWLLASTRKDTRVYRLPDRTELRPKVTTFIGLFEARDGSEARGASVLYQKLLAPALAELPAKVRRLAIIPDDFLHRLPFAALRPEPDGEPLATRYEIVLAPSATLWLRWRKTRPAPTVTPALVLADPVTLVTRGDAAGERSASILTPARLGPLPFARTEGKSVMRHLGSGELLVGEDASETYLKRKGAGSHGLLHFAAHAVTDAVNPERSGVYLSPGDRKEDGLLQVREIADLDLDGRIIVLSTCESASGEILRGEGVMGLARAFFQAGAHTVVASLWPLRDDDGAALFDRFYRHLSEGMSVAASLQAAQRDRMDDGAPAEAWAGVVVLGDGDRVPVPGGRRPGPLPWTVVLIAVLVLAYGARLALQRRRTSA